MDTLVFLCCFQLPKQENLHKPFEWHSKINMAHTHTPAYLHCPLIIKLLHTPLRLVFFPLQFNKLLEENLSKSPSFSQLLPVVIQSWYHKIPSVPMIQDVKWKSPWCI